MTVTGAGGVVIKRLSTSSGFDRQYKKLPPEIKQLVPEKINDLGNSQQIIPQFLRNTDAGQGLQP